MKVILVGNTVYPDRIGGLPRYVRELAGRLARAGCEVSVLAKSVAQGLPEVETAGDGVRIIRHPVPSKRNPLFGPAYPVYTARGILGAIRRERGADAVVHAHFAVTALPLAMAGIPYLLTFHAPLWRELLDERQSTYRLPGRLQRPAILGLRGAERLVVRRAETTFVLSQYMREQLRELSEPVAAAAHVLPGGVDLEKFSPDRGAERASAEAPLLFTARRLTPRTGVDQLLSALPLILRVHPNATLAVAGSGEMEPGLRRLAADLAITGRVRFLGEVPDHELVEWYRRATLVVMPTVKLEGFGLTIVEALACGTPVVGTPVGAIPELLEPIDPLLLASDNTAGALATAINELLADGRRLDAIGQRGRARIVASMGWDAIVGRYLSAYEAALRTRSLRPRPSPARR